MTTHTELVKALAKPGEDILKSLTPKTCHVLHMAVGISGEVDELLSACLNQDKKNIVEELGDVEFYCEGLRQVFGISVARRPMAFPPSEMIVLEMIMAKGDLLDQVKKLTIYNDPERWDKIVNALINFYRLLDTFYDMFNVDRKLVMERHHAKLNVRYAEGKYTDKSAQTRADKAKGE